MPIFALNFYSVFIWAALVNCMPIKERSRRLVFLGIVFVQFTLLAWQREFTVGQDTLAYYHAFIDLSNISFGEALTYAWEPGYVMWNWIVSHSGFDFHAYLLFTGAFIYYSFSRFVYRYSSCVWLSVIIFIAFGYYFGSFHILRQYIALAIVLYSYDYILKRKLISFVTLVFIASLFHMSAIAFIPTYYICHKNMRIPILTLVFGVCLTLAFYFGDIIMEYIVVSEKYASIYLGEADAAGRGYSMLVLVVAIMALALIFKPHDLDDRKSVFYWIFFISVCVQPFATIVSMVSRGMLYWLISVTVFLPLIINSIKDKRIRLLSYIIVSVGLIVFFEFITNSLEGIERYATYEFYKPR